MIVWDQPSSDSGRPSAPVPWSASSVGSVVDHVQLLRCFYMIVVIGETLQMWCIWRCYSDIDWSTLTLMVIWIQYWIDVVRRDVLAVKCTLMERSFSEVKTWGIDGVTITWVVMETCRPDASPLHSYSPASPWSSASGWWLFMIMVETMIRRSRETKDACQRLLDKKYLWEWEVDKKYLPPRDRLDEDEPMSLQGHQGWMWSLQVAFPHGTFALSWMWYWTGQECWYQATVGVGDPVTEQARVTLKIGNWTIVKVFVLVFAVFSPNVFVIIFIFCLLITCHDLLYIKCCFSSSLGQADKVTYGADPVWKAKKSSHPPNKSQ